MKTQTIIPHPFRWAQLSLACLALLLSDSARASIAYGSINNFDTVNDTGNQCHGFEIELEDCHSTDISYTYNYNHYGTPNITEDNSVAGHPKCVIRWESKKNPDGTWAAFTAVPSGPIAPTNGHMFTNRQSTSAASISAWATACNQQPSATTGSSIKVARWCVAEQCRLRPPRSPIFLPQRLHHQPCRP